jgi:hypothetical protein
MRIFDADADIAVERFRTPLEAMDHPQLIHNGDVSERVDPQLGRLRELGPLVLRRRSSRPGRLRRARPARSRPRGWRDRRPEPGARPRPPRCSVRSQICSCSSSPPGWRRRSPRRCWPSSARA